SPRRPRDLPSFPTRRSSDLRLLAHRHPRWDDERLFQTTRNILIVLLIKLVVEEYINHITPYHFRFTLDPRLLSLLAHAPWHRERSEEHTSELQSRENLVCRL